MEFFIFLGILGYSGSVFFSYQLEKQLDVSLFQQVMDQGYHIDIHKWKEMQEMLEESSEKKFSWKYLLFGVNLFQATYRYWNQKKEMPKILRQLELFGVLEKMSDKERMDYQNNTSLVLEQLQEKLVEQEEVPIQQEEISSIVAIGDRKQTLETLREELLAHSCVPKEESPKVFIK